MSKDKGEITYLSDFDALAMRLKHELGIKQDYELAEFFKITPQAYNARKKSNNFPIKKLKEILEQRSDLSYVDLRWVLTGKTEMEELFCKSEPMHSEEFNLKGESRITKLKELPRTQQELVFNIIDVLHTEMNINKWEKIKKIP